MAATSADRIPADTDSLEFPGRAIHALFESAHLDRYAGRTVPVAELASAFKLRDIDA